ncbi:MAG TPA: hypothetical protein VMR74_09620 [Gammaproteobacteria bacterium]|nr:hypothetical protein [Gammaproteobacteria bacterium]
MSDTESALKTTRCAAMLGFASALLALAPVRAQIDDSIRGAPREANHFIATPAGWQHPMTPWREPDLEASLDMMQASRVPLERCADSYAGRRLPTFLFGDAPGTGGGARPRPCDPHKAWLTQAEYDARIAQWRNQTDPSREALAEGDLGRSMQTGTIDPAIPQRQTNLIVDPPSGLLPALTAEGKRRALTMRSGWTLPGENHTYDRPGDFDSWDRCITRGMPSSMMPYRYNGGFRIVQAPGYVVFQLEMIHEARMIPTDGRDPLEPAIEQYMGESRGRWEGTTLVVETSNYREGPPMINLGVVGSPPGNRFPYSSEMKTTERIVRLNDDWWLYEITTEDPVVLTRPFTVRYPMRNDPGYFAPEYACHEHNTIVPNYVAANRAERENPTPIPEEPVEVPIEIAEALAGRWIGRPRIATLDLDIELEFVRRSDDVVVGSLIGTTLGEIGEPLTSVAIEARTLRFELPNWQPWSFAGELTDNGTIVGALSSEQGGVPVTFRRRAARE